MLCNHQLIVGTGPSMMSTTFGLEVLLTLVTPDSGLAFRPWCCSFICRACMATTVCTNLRARQPSMLESY